jgi:hypothetical protein
VDVYQALKEVGFEKYLGELKDFMANYNADKEDTVAIVGGMPKKRGHAGVTVSAGKLGDAAKDQDEDMEDDEDEVA